MTSSSPTSPAAALPVVLAVRGRLGDPVRRLVEGELGWQPVDAATAGLVPPAARIADVHAAPDTVPTVLLVTAEDDASAAAEAARRLRPAAVVRWPTSAVELATHAEVATRAASPTVTRTRQLRVGGAGGGVGATTVAAGLAGLAAWRGEATLWVSSEVTAVPAGAPAVTEDALAAPDLWSRAATVDGVHQARAVRSVGAVRGEVMVTDGRIGTMVLDVGVADDVDVLVCSADARGLAALERTTAAAVVIVGDGAVHRRTLHAAIGRRRRVELPRSARVARAAVVGRLPASLPGSHVRPLAPLLPSPAVGPRAGPD